MTDPSQPQASGHSRSTSLALILSLMLITLLLTFQALRYRPSPAVAADAPQGVFSAQRAIDALAVVLGDESPHPTGSAANYAVRDRLVARLISLGYAPEIQTGRSCDEWGDCALVENIVARLDGREAGSAVALTAHYDSVGAGPGAADDGIGVATVLEIARLLKAGQPQPRHSVLLLITEGEETGLLGARVFVDEHPWAKEVRAAVNLEARGNDGPSFMFETGRHNAWAMALYQGSVARPITNSIYYTAYQLLPNDTDFTVFKAAGWEGYNFALTGNVQHYHTPRDSLANLSRDSLQHHGDNALSMLMALAEAPLPAGETSGMAPAGDAVYVDLFAKRLLAWPAALAVPIAAGSALVWALFVGVQLRRRRLGLRELALATAASILAMLLAALACWMLLLTLRSVSAIPPAAASYHWSAHPLPLDIASAALAALALSIVARLLKTRVGLTAGWSATGLLLSLATLASAMLLPGLGFAFQLPLIVLLLVAGPAALSRQGSDRALTLALVMAALVATSVFVPTIGFLHQSLGPDALIVAAALLVWVYLPLLGLIGSAGVWLQRSLLAAALATAVVSSAIAAWLPMYSEASPQRLNLEYLLDTDRGAAEWLARPDSGVLPPELASTAVFSPRPTPVFPWSRGQVWRADAPEVGLPAPALHLLGTSADGGGLRYEARLQSPRGANSISLCWPPGSAPTRLVLGGHRLPEPDTRTLKALETRRAGWRCISDHALNPDGVTLAFTLPSAAPVEALLFDRSAGLPPAGLKLLMARPETAVRSQDGDVTRLIRRVRISPP
ncbi:M20/M25/M40 family metallo-hydrolase [uncultured Nevskia sp.]|uniref:M20/M25/M40 family metallo-hydrolase n=1 Tax=uncultured Nevskia sp. TaxID=228950 RepID=UPI0025DBB496|nr:M20/M25/M40 family metallo-hydrolase [uncultured Nevskia sp.]